MLAVSPDALHQRSFENSWIRGCAASRRIAAVVEFANTNDNGVHSRRRRATLRTQRKVNTYVQTRRGGRGGREKAKRSGREAAEKEKKRKKKKKKPGEDGERCCVLKGDIPWMIFYSWPSSPPPSPLPPPYHTSTSSPGLLGPVDAVLAAPP